MTKRSRPTVNATPTTTSAPTTFGRGSEWLLTPPPVPLRERRDDYGRRKGGVTWVTPSLHQHSLSWCRLRCESEEGFSANCCFHKLFQANLQNANQEKKTFMETHLLSFSNTMSRVGKCDLTQLKECFRFKRRENWLEFLKDIKTSNDLI